MRTKQFNVGLVLLPVLIICSCQKRSLQSSVSIKLVDSISYNLGHHADKNLSQWYFSNSTKTDHFTFLIEEKLSVLDFNSDDEYPVHQHSLPKELDYRYGIRSFLFLNQDTIFIIPEIDGRTNKLVLFNQGGITKIWNIDSLRNDTKMFVLAGYSFYPLEYHEGKVHFIQYSQEYKSENGRIESGDFYKIPHEITFDLIDEKTRQIAEYPEEMIDNSRYMGVFFKTRKGDSIIWAYSYIPKLHVGSSKDDYNQISKIDIQDQIDFNDGGFVKDGSRAQVFFESDVIHGVKWDPYRKLYYISMTKGIEYYREGGTKVATTKDLEEYLIVLDEDFLFTNKFYLKDFCNCTSYTMHVGKDYLFVPSKDSHGANRKFYKLKPVLHE